MSEEIENIQESPVEEPVTKKDPRRVEQGKRLAAISKQAKEDKMRKKILEEEKLNSSIIPYIMYSIAGISTFGFFYLLFKKDNSDYKMTVIHQSPKKESPKKKFENLN